MKPLEAALAALVLCGGCSPRAHQTAVRSHQGTEDLLAVLHGERNAPFQKSLALRLAKQGRCGAAIFHWNRAQRLPGKLQPSKAETKLMAGCAKKLTGKGPMVEPSGHAALWRALQTPRVFLRATMTFHGSNDEQKHWAASQCKKQDQCNTDRWPPLEEVSLPAFAMGRTEVTVGQWNRCVQAGHCSGRVSGPDRLPVTGRDMSQAESYCHWAGGRLPTEQEWERAARPQEEPVALWPWGDQWISGCARLELPENRGPAPVGTNPCDLSRAGLADMAGNVAEWARPGPDIGPGKGLVKGGSWSDPRWRGALFARLVVPAGRKDAHIGFRCVWPQFRSSLRRK